MKTSTKIFLTLAGLLILMQIGFGINSAVQYKRMKVAAVNLGEQIDATTIRIVDFDSGKYEPEEWLMNDMFLWREHGFLNIGYKDILTSYVSGDTLYLRYNNWNGRKWPVYQGHGLEKAIIHVDGLPDRLIDISPDKTRL